MNERCGCNLEKRHGLVHCWEEMKIYINCPVMFLMNNISQKMLLLGILALYSKLH